MSIQLNQKGLTMLGYGTADISPLRNDVWRSMVGPSKEGYCSLKLRELIHKVLPEPEARSVLQEIVNYKWLQTEKLVGAGELEKGSSLTLDQAAKEWMVQYYPAWKSARPTLIEATRYEESEPHPTQEEAGT